MSDPNKTAAKLGVIGLASIVISSMVGGGVFSLPQNMAANASAAAVLLAWVITGFGMYFIANTFSVLSRVKPDLTAGIYMYAREGFGPYVGFTIGWGYWLCQIFGNVGYAVITMDALNYFFPPHFAGGNNLLSIVCGSVLIWGFNFIVLRGVKQATILNIIGTIGKLVPLLAFCVIMLFAFHADKFDFNFLGKMAEGGHTLGSLPSQLKSTMLVTLWSFIGIEGAVVLSNRAKNQAAVSKATLLGFLGCLVIYIGLSVLPFGFLTQAEIAGVANPSTAGVLEKVAPDVSLWVTSALMQLAILMVYFSNNAWNTMLSITGVMVLPAYLASTLYLWKLVEDGDFSKLSPTGRAAALATSVLGTGFAIWLLYAAGLKYLFLAAIFLACGIPVFIWARKQKKDGKAVFIGSEKAIVTLLITAALAAIYAFGRGLIKL